MNEGENQMVPKRTLTLAAGAAFLALLVAGLTGCSGSTTPQNPGTTKTFTSTVANSHTHTVTIQRSDVETMPMAGITMMTSSNSAHTHSFAMTQAQLIACNGGGMVMVMTGSSDVGGAHTHDFSITKWF
jgi:hypothetical protein